jgi:hypothetical protein
MYIFMYLLRASTFLIVITYGGFFLLQRKEVFYAMRRG